MSARKIHPHYLVGTPTSAAVHDNFEFDEADVWGGNDVVTGNKSEPNNNKSKLNNYSPHRPIWKPARKIVECRHPPVGPKSLPVNIPDWSKILGDEYTNHGSEFFTDDDEEEEDDGILKLPPHEYLARTRTASFSVHEGIGRTLKGRDMSRVRNAIWKQIGLIDED